MKDLSIVIKIKDGKLDIEALGYEGEGCDDATKFLEELGTLETVTKKREYRRNARQAESTGRRVRN
jgi:hypothetical protein